MAGDTVQQAAAGALVGRARCYGQRPGVRGGLSRAGGGRYSPVLCRRPRRLQPWSAVPRHPGAARQLARRRPRRRRLTRSLANAYDTIPDAILTCAGKLNLPHGNDI